MVTESSDFALTKFTRLHLDFKSDIPHERESLYHCATKPFFGRILGPPI